MAPRTDPWKWSEQRQESRTRNSLHQKLWPCSCSLCFFVNMSHHCSGLKLSGFSRWSVPWSNFPSSANLIVQEFTWSGDRWDKGRCCRALNSGVRGWSWRGMTQEKTKGEKEDGNGKLMFLQPSYPFIKASHVVHFSSGRDLCDSSLYPCYQDSAWHTMGS